MKVSELGGTQLDVWVALALGERRSTLYEPTNEAGVYWLEMRPGSASVKECPRYSTDPRAGFPIIESERIRLTPVDAGGFFLGELQNAPGWLARLPDQATNERGDTALQAAMRSFVASKFGETVSDD
ncbi:phage protein NinX family protein [Burkholderia sp. Ac-20365]|uniref:phage protein NinX family protein n=1 Tax=Burkholderia sp. Ac-20365 TaxID=2703897 RepID=UPI00197BAA66|nr:phage protein NinX family protein [Burkholderia sp. Ac-20365]MBN3761280.1 DUF2591 domain-containing protein [Burkholderia sp. Ac-20365]